MTAVIVPEAEAQIREIDEWWRANRPLSPDLFAQELSEAIALIEAWSVGVGGIRR